MIFLKSNPIICLKRNIKAKAEVGAEAEAEVEAEVGVGTDQKKIVFIAIKIKTSTKEKKEVAVDIITEVEAGVTMHPEGQDTSQGEAGVVSRVPIKVDIIILVAKNQNVVHKAGVEVEVKITIMREARIIEESLICKEINDTSRIIAEMDWHLLTNGKEGMTEIITISMTILFGYILLLLSLLSLFICLFICYMDNLFLILLFIFKNIIMDN